jgi:hypothetical protein
MYGQVSNMCMAQCMTQAGQCMSTAKHVHQVSGSHCSDTCTRSACSRTECTAGQATCAVLPAATCIRSAGGSGQSTATLLQPKLAALVWESPCSNLLCGKGCAGPQGCRDPLFLQDFHSALTSHHTLHSS